MRTSIEKLFALAFVASMVVLSGCSDDEPSVDAPNARFTVAVDGLTVTFTDASVGADTYDWDFGDESGTSADASPTHTYAAAGSYTVTLTVTNAGGEDTTEETVVVASPLNESFLTGTWTVRAEEAALAVGPSEGSAEWWFLPAADVETRSCGLDDEYIFAADGSFSIDHQEETFLEEWQGTDGCGAPVAPHDGSGTYTYSVSGLSFTVSGEGAYVGLAKVVNAGELPNVDVPASVTYTVLEFAEDGGTKTMKLSVEAGSGVFWTFLLTSSN